MNVTEEVTSLTPLMAAAQCGHLDIVDKLIKAGCNVNAVLKVHIYVIGQRDLHVYIIGPPER